MIDIRIRNHDETTEETRIMEGAVTLSDIGVVLIELENAKLWLLEHAEEDFAPEMSIKDSK